jgi:hypothetical protein
MWLVIPLIYFLSWRTCRNFRQSFRETVAWCVGYLAVAGLILLSNYASSLTSISGLPDNPAAVAAIAGGFLGMGISRIRWKRRGGHLQRSSSPWVRAFDAMRSRGIGKTHSSR